MEFGRYTLTKRVAAGGMAEVWKAKATGAAGFEKTVAIKKVLPNLASDSAFTQMFIEEAKLAAALTHANVVQVFDFGQVGEDQYYLAMEYVAGASLAVLLKRLAEKRASVSREAALYVIVEAARGLGYAHTRTGPGGKPLGIVHRDVSPHNLLVSFDGEVKVADFGIARVASRVSTTATGQVRGKASYMSPEQARGEPLDARSDLFCLGLVLYELLFGRKLFDGESTGEIMGRVAFWNPLTLAANAPPDGTPGALSPEIEALLRKALAAKTEDRFADATAFEAACTALLGTEGFVKGRRDLAARMREHCAAELAAEQRADEPSIPSNQVPTKKLPDSPAPRKSRPAMLLATAVIAVAVVVGGFTQGRKLFEKPVPLSPAQQWFADVRTACNLLEVDSKLSVYPPPPGVEGAGYAAACFVLAGKTDRSRDVIAALPESERPVAAQAVFDIAGGPASSDDDATTRVMSLVLEFSPSHDAALLRAGLAEYRMGSDSAATAHLQRFLELHPQDDEPRKEAAHVLERVKAFALLRAEARARAAATPRAMTTGTSMAAIPAGCFEMGDAEGEPDELPKKRVCVGAFLLERDEVTNRRYREFLAADPTRPVPKNANAEFDYWTDDRDVPEALLDAPVVNVSWTDAAAFCAWDGGKRLPGEAEWEWAARGGRENARFPWGDDPPVDETGSEHGARFGIEDWRSGAALKPVGSYAVNGYGLHDMAGSVWEWTSDRYRADWYLVREGESGKGPDDGECCVVRGGAWMSKDGSHLRVSNRLFIGDARPSEALRGVGFRCAADAE